MISRRPTAGGQAARHRLTAQLNRLVMPPEGNTRRLEQAVARQLQPLVRRQARIPMKQGLRYIIDLGSDAATRRLRYVMVIREIA